MLLDLEGYLSGIALDKALGPEEARLLKHWLIINSPMLSTPPFDQLYARVESTLTDGLIEEEEWKDMVWLCQSLTKAEGGGHQRIIFDMRRLQGLLRGILADRAISQEELFQLESWLMDHRHMEGYWPYDEIFRIVKEVLRDGQLSVAEEDLLHAYFNDFSLITPEAELKGSTSRVPSMLSGVLAHEPKIEFKGYRFSFTGISLHGSRERLMSTIHLRGGHYQKEINENLDYLVVGKGVSDPWVFSCFGRKVEEAVTLRQGGVPLVIVDEIDFWKCVEG